jgi:hypothetical protein
MNQIVPMVDSFRSLHFVLTRSIYCRFFHLSCSSSY